jgi:hypothetical protein
VDPHDLLTRGHRRVITLDGTSSDDGATAWKVTRRRAAMPASQLGVPIARWGFGRLLVVTRSAVDPSPNASFSAPATHERQGSILGPVRGWGPLVTNNAAYAHANARLPSCAVIAPDRAILKGCLDALGHVPVCRCLASA